MGTYHVSGCGILENRVRCMHRPDAVEPERWRHLMVPFSRQFQSVSVNAHTNTGHSLRLPARKYLPRHLSTLRACSPLSIPRPGGMPQSLPPPPTRSVDISEAPPARQGARYFNAITCRCPINTCTFVSIAYLDVTNGRLRIIPPTVVAGKRLGEDDVMLGAVFNGLCVSELGQPPHGVQVVRHCMQGRALRGDSATQIVATMVYSIILPCLRASHVAKGSGLLGALFSWEGRGRRGKWSCAAPSAAFNCSARQVTSSEETDHINDEDTAMGNLLSFGIVQPCVTPFSFGIVQASQACSQRCINSANRQSSAAAAVGIQHQEGSDVHGLPALPAYGTAAACMALSRSPG